MDKTHITIPISYELTSAVKINPIISKYTVRVLYCGKNRNRVYFSKEVVEKMLETVGGIPVIGQYDKASQDFMAHGDLVFRTNSDGTSEVVTEGTEPYGFVDSTPNYWWAEHLDKDGVKREYLHLEVYLWTGRYPELECLEEGKNNHSMEIEAFGNWQDVDGEEYFVCDENTYFTGLCILGREVEPCFEGSSIFPQFALLKEERMKELKEALIAFNLNAKQEEKIKDEDEIEPELEPESSESKENEVFVEEEQQQQEQKPEPEEKAEDKETTVVSEEDKENELEEKYIKTLEILSAKEEYIKKLEEEIGELREANKEYNKIIEKNEKEKLLNTFVNKISKENYSLLSAEIDNYDIKELKIKALEFSVDYLSNNNIFNYSSDIVSAPRSEINQHEFYDADSWQMRVLRKQEEK